MEPTRCITSKLISSVVVWRNPGTEDLSSLSRTDRVLYNGRVFATEIVLIPLVLIATIESIAYMILVGVIFVFEPALGEHYDRASALLDSSLYVMGWSVILLERNLTQTHLLEHESFVRLGINVFPYRWDHLAYIYQVTADDLRAHPAINHPRSREMKLLIERGISLEELINKTPKYIGGTKPTGEAWSAFKENVALVTNYKKLELNNQAKARPARHKEYSELAILNLRQQLQELGENGDPVKIADLKEALAGLEEDAKKAAL